MSPSHHRSKRVPVKKEFVLPRESIKVLTNSVLNELCDAKPVYMNTRSSKNRRHSMTSSARVLLYEAANVYLEDVFSKSKGLAYEHGRREIACCDIRQAAANLSLSLSNE